MALAGRKCRPVGLERWSKLFGGILEVLEGFDTSRYGSEATFLISFLRLT